MSSQACRGDAKVVNAVRAMRATIVEINEAYRHVKCSNADVVTVREDAAAAN